MDLNEENKAWAIKIMLSFDGYVGFPKSSEGLGARVRCFLEMLPSREAGDWLAQKLLRTENQMPTCARMREVLDMQYPPED